MVYISEVFSSLLLPKKSTHIHHDMIFQHSSDMYVYPQSSGDMDQSTPTEKCAGGHRVLLKGNICAWDFPGSPVVKTPSIQYRRHRLDPWLGS